MKVSHSYAPCSFYRQKSESLASGNFFLLLGNYIQSSLNQGYFFKILSYRWWNHLRIQFTLCFEIFLTIERLLVSKILYQLFFVCFLLKETVAWRSEQEIGKGKLFLLKILMSSMWEFPHTNQFSKSVDTNWCQSGTNHPELTSDPTG